ncbi:hypothetical protein F5Y04DRAFT_245324 [Hypomontagnella monticulosa]|nr:hypothetical protein F5Y04DRAFT_245324 [Hypomontagnella monticulosa]
MPPAKSKANHDDAKSETASVKDRNGHGSDHRQPNGKQRRNGANGGAPAQNVIPPGGILSTATTVPVSQTNHTPGLQWPSFDRDVLHDYRRRYLLSTPTAFANPYHHWVLSRPGIGLRSPTMARKLEYRRQSKEDLTKVVRKHFNALGVQETDVIVDFVHKVRNPGVVKIRRNKDLPHSSPLP